MNKVVVPSLRDIITQPDVSTLAEQYEQFHTGNSLVGKFIRIGQLVLLAPHIQALLFADDKQPQEVMHMGIAVNAIKIPNVRSTIKAAQVDDSHLSKLLDEQYAISDAGYYKYVPEPTIQNLYIHGISGRFYRADAAGREETVLLAQQAIGNQVCVINSDKI